MQILSRRFLNNFSTVLTSSWGTSGGASLPPIASGEMDKLLAATVNGEHLIATLSNADESVIEIIRLNRGAAVFTSVRGQEGTTAVSWDAGSKIKVRITADSLNLIANELKPKPGTIGFLALFGATYVTADLDQYFVSSVDDIDKNFSVYLGAGVTEVRFTTAETSKIVTFNAIMVFDGASSIPTIKINGTTKTPYGTGPTNGVNYVIEISLMGAAGIRLEYKIRS